MRNGDLMAKFSRMQEEIDQLRSMVQLLALRGIAQPDPGVITWGVGFNSDYGKRDDPRSTIGG